MWMIRIDELVYLIHEDIFLYHKMKGFDNKFLEVSRNETKNKMMEGFNELMYLMHVSSLLSVLSWEFIEKFPKVSRKEEKEKMMDRFNGSNQTQRSIVMIN